MRSIEEVVTRICTGSYELSPRGHKKDYTETAARNFHSDDSFVGLDGRDYLDHQSKDWLERKEEVLIRDGGKCHVCGGVGSDPHHIIPLGSSGSDDLDNLMTLCRKCHHAMHPEKQLQWTGGKNGS